jgi:hypothetical protein
LIILKLLVLSLSKLLFGCFSPLQFHVVRRLINLISIMSFSVGPLTKRYTCSNLQAFLILLFPLMCVGCISLYIVWNKLLGHGTLAWVIIFSLLDFVLIRLTHHYSSCVQVIFFIYWFILMIFYLLDAIQSCFTAWYSCWALSLSFGI